MPIQVPQWTDFLSCPLCANEFDTNRLPITLACAHTLCKPCLKNLQREQCPFDQAVIRRDIDAIPVNFALLQLTVFVDSQKCASLKEQIHLNVRRTYDLTEAEFEFFLQASKCMEEAALFLNPYSEAGNVCYKSNKKSFPLRVSRSVQRKLVTLANCQLLEPEGRSRVARTARSLGERIVTELIIYHQNPQQLSANLWAAIRARGCQFLGPAMQDEVLKLILLALEDGSALSRKVLVMFVVQKLEPHFPQASKTSIGHVVQLLFRASCFDVSKREGDSSLMRLKVEYRTYEALRREHDAQIVEIATEAGLRIAPDQWSSLLYGDTSHRSHMQSIADKLQKPESFVQSVQDLVIALQRTGDPENFNQLRPQFLRLADINVECSDREWADMKADLEAVCDILKGFVRFVRARNFARGPNKNVTEVDFPHQTDWAKILNGTAGEMGYENGAIFPHTSCPEIRHVSSTEIQRTRKLIDGSTQTEEDLEDGMEKLTIAVVI